LKECTLYLISFLSYCFEASFLIWWGEREGDKWARIGFGILPLGSLLETGIANTYDCSSFRWEELFLLVLKK